VQPFLANGLPIRVPVVRSQRRLKRRGGRLKSPPARTRGGGDGESQPLLTQLHFIRSRASYQLTTPIPLGRACSSLAGSREVVGIAPGRHVPLGDSAGLGLVGVDLPLVLVFPSMVGEVVRYMWFSLRTPGWGRAGRPSRPWSCVVDLPWHLPRHSILPIESAATILPRLVILG
jgi:hypothetical protein